MMPIGYMGYQVGSHLGHNHLHHGSFVGVREDKKAKDVVRESGRQ
jgi:hypothetical protein